MHMGQQCTQGRAEGSAEGSDAGEGQNGMSSPICAGARLFPFMLHQRCPDLFSYAASNFQVHRSKAGTARVVCWQELGIANRCVLHAPTPAHAGARLCAVLLEVTAVALLQLGLSAATAAAAVYLQAVLVAHQCFRMSADCQ